MNESHFCKSFKPLVSDPEVFTSLTHAIGGQNLSFQDVVGFEPEDLMHLPRPAYALTVVFPETDTDEARKKENALRQKPQAVPPPGLIWLRQTINNACGLYAILHAIVNTDAVKHLAKGSFLDLVSSPTVSTAERIAMVEESKDVEEAYLEALDEDDLLFQTGVDESVEHHYIAVVKSDDGLYWLDGETDSMTRLCNMKDGYDVLDECALKCMRDMLLQSAAGKVDCRYSILALVPVQ